MIKKRFIHSWIHWTLVSACITSGPLLDTGVAEKTGTGPQGAHRLVWQRWIRKVREWCHQMEFTSGFASVTRTTNNDSRTRHHWEDPSEAEAPSTTWRLRTGCLRRVRRSSTLPSSRPAQHHVERSPLSLQREKRTLWGQPEPPQPWGRFVGCLHSYFTAWGLLGNL